MNHQNVIQKVKDKVLALLAVNLISAKNFKNCYFVGNSLGLKLESDPNFANVIYWHKPPINFFKLNVDGTSTDCIVDCGGVIRDCNGGLIVLVLFKEATKLVQPFTRRGGFSSISNIKWEDVVSLDSLKNAFNRCIIQRIKHPEDYEELGVDMEVGFILHGPPGCGKTLIAKALVNEAGANFIHIKLLIEMDGVD
ncbi:putative ribosome biogenesis ATPase nvl isoform X2 [Dendrobium catenatum]|uniref:putative ribosome biogenesis ATPase nvl isoform X2 n=1 Tax=Dendrobium catenatum TaxID=906689 RepID=UPI00109F5489|nr:putative ribosome biogenesis ATPase nvl isoform X2 [Dendrobium catenatum]XP_028549837.1 putative ribosome biogenesis ATPase nvl isoform X2 [Dendrobium catenatum]